MKEKQYVKWVREMFKKYAPILFIEQYHLKVTPLPKDDDTFLSSTFNYPYLDIEINYSKKAVETWSEDKKDSERRLIHEFCHTITDPIYELSIERYVSKGQLNDAREHLTDHIAQIINKHYNLI